MSDSSTQSIPQQGRKWLKGVTPDDPLSKAAEIALSARLAYVAAYLPLAASPEQEDLEAVHQLRVASRRAAAALAAFEPCMPRRRTRKMKRRLRRVRRAAGTARDLDVLMLRLARGHAATGAGELEEPLEYLKQDRADAQPALVAVAEDLPLERFERKNFRLVERIRWREDGPEPVVASFGQRHVHDVAEDFLQAARPITRDSPVEALHNLRIAAKRLRYTIELFACAADGGLRHDVYPLVEDLQERLGEMNDHASAEQYFRTCAQSAGSSGLSGKFNRLANHELHARDASIESFHRWWSAARLDEIYSGAVNAFPPSTAA